MTNRWRLAIVGCLALVIIAIATIVIVQRSRTPFRPLILEVASQPVDGHVFRLSSQPVRFQDPELFEALRAALARSRFEKNDGRYAQDRSIVRISVRDTLDRVIELQWCNM